MLEIQQRKNSYTIVRKEGLRTRTTMSASRIGVKLAIREFMKKRLGPDWPKKDSVKRVFGQ